MAPQNGAAEAMLRLVPQNAGRQALRLAPRQKLVPKKWGGRSLAEVGTPKWGGRCLPEVWCPKTGRQALGLVPRNQLTESAISGAAGP